MNRKVYAVIFAIILLLLPFQIMHPYNRNPNVNISGNNVIRPYNSDTFRVIGQGIVATDYVVSHVEYFISQSVHVFPVEFR